MIERTRKPKPSPPAVMPALSALLQRKCTCGGTPCPTGECDACRRKRMTLQRKGTQSSTLDSQPSEVPPIVYDVLRSSGQPLDAEVRAFMEPRFGHDFSQVRTRAHEIVPVPARLAIGAPHDEF